MMGEDGREGGKSGGGGGGGVSGGLVEWSRVVLDKRHYLPCGSQVT